LSNGQIKGEIFMIKKLKSVWEVFTKRKRLNPMLPVANEVCGQRGAPPRATLPVRSPRKAAINRNDIIFGVTILLDQDKDVKCVKTFMLNTLWTD
jgi:hypothetical protein